MKGKEKIDALRKYMKDYGMAAYIVPSDDFHSSEYVGAYFKAREYMSGFTGSAGTLVVLEDEAALWTDGRYFLQAEKELAGSGIFLMRSGQPDVPKMTDYLLEHLDTGSVIGFDGRTVTGHFVKELAGVLEEKQICFSGDMDLVDMVWKERPLMSKEPVWELDTAYAGLSREEKLSKVRGKMKEAKADVLVLAALDEIAWLLNLRGNDVMYTPVFLAYMLITQGQAELFVQEEIISEEIRQRLKAAGVWIMPYGEIDERLSGLAGEQSVWLDEGVVNYHLSGCLPEGIRRIDSASPVERLKAVKTPEEMEHIRQAHVKDGVAVTKFICWLKTHVEQEKITERSAAEKLLEYRRQMEGFIGESFEPIIAYGAHGAIVHYAATKESDVQMQPEGFCLADTGGHFLEGTTDITRTIALGKPTEEEKRMFTIALRGNLRLGGALFLQGVCGQNLDYLAREPLWENHLDFNHGTGHGVGYLLNVHEGPQRIHWRIKEDGHYVPFEEGMVVSNEPGIYLEGRFGIRHENLLLCRNGEKNEYGQFMHFETLTLVPFDRDAVEPSLMTEEELALLNAYHEKVYAQLAPYFEGEELMWLKKATAEIVR